MTLTAIAATATEKLLQAISGRGLKTTQSAPNAWQAQCPAHADKLPSLSIRQIDGAALIYCHAGCQTDDVLAALNLGKPDLFDSPKGSQYDYKDRSGKIVRSVFRSPSKEFRQNVIEKQIVSLFNLQEVLEAEETATDIYVTEGEKDALTLKSLGVTATSAPMGAANWKRADYEPLRGPSSVIIVTDMDEAGYVRAAGLKAHLIPIVGGSVRIVAPKVGKDATDHVMAGFGIDDLVPFDSAIKDLLPVTEIPNMDSAAGSFDLPDDDGGAKKSASTVIVEIALSEYSLHVTEDGEAFAVPLEGIRHVARRIRGGRQSLRAELAKTYYRATGRTAPQQALSDAMLTVEGMAQDENPEVLHLRVAEAHGAIWIDTGDNDGHVIKISGGKFTIVTEAPVLFHRTALTMPMPVPESGGDIAELWPFVNVAEEDRSLLVASMVGSFSPDIAHPITTLTGEQGTGKSTATKTITELIDPSSVPLRKAPRDAEAWVTAAAGSWVVAVDNLSQVQDWFSDSLCRAVTGDGDVRRALYTDGGLAVFSFRRQVMLTGIDFAGLRGDLSERLLLINLKRISDENRMGERELNERWAEAKPRILGALLDILAKTHLILPSLELDNKPRMADFARVLKAVDQVQGTHGLERYMEQSKEIAADTLTSSSFVLALLDQISDFEGTAAELLAEVLPPSSESRAPRDWPKNARAVTSMLKRDAPALRKNGWTVDDLGIHNEGKVTRWALVRPEIARIGSPRTPSPPANQPKTGDTGNTGHDNGQSHNGLPSEIVPLEKANSCSIHGTPLYQGQCGRCGSES